MAFRRSRKRCDGSNGYSPLHLKLCFARFYGGVQLTSFCLSLRLDRCCSASQLSGERNAKRARVFSQSFSDKREGASSIGESDFDKMVTVIELNLIISIAVFGLRPIVLVSCWNLIRSQLFLLNIPNILLSLLARFLLLTNTSYKHEAVLSARCLSDTEFGRLC